MKQMLLTHFPFMSLSIAALLIFFLFFVGLLVWIKLDLNRVKFENAEQMPLHDGEQYERL